MKVAWDLYARMQNERRDLDLVEYTTRIKEIRNNEEYDIFFL